MAAFPRVYRSFAEFERNELRKLDSLRTTVEDLMEERFAEESLFDDYDELGRPRKRRRRGR